MGTGFSKMVPIGCLVSLAFAGCLTEGKGGGDGTTTTPWTADSILPVGAQDNPSYGMAVDVDQRRVLSSGAADSAQDSLDVLFAYHGGFFVLIAPRIAIDSGIGVAAGFDPDRVKSIQFVKVDTVPVDWDAGVAAYETGDKVGYSAVFANDAFVIKSTEDNYSMLTINTITGSSAMGVATISIRLKRSSARNR